MPASGGSATSWGDKLNADLAAIDGQVFINQTAITANQAPIGSIMMFGGATAPTNWLLCDGTVYANTAIPLLAPILANRYNAGTSAVAGTSSAVPNLNGRFPFGAGATYPLATTGGAANVTLDQTMIPALTFTVPAHGHGANASASSTSSQNSHSHYVYQDAHSHNATQPAHSHSVSPNALTANAGGNAGAAAGWGFNTLSTGTAQPAISVDTQQPAVHADTQQPSITTSTSVSVSVVNAAAMSTNTLGGGLSHANIPPYLAITFIIRYQ
jgi:microcystin-dependent protein